MPGEIIETGEIWMLSLWNNSRLVRVVGYLAFTLVFFAGVVLLYRSL